MSFNWEQETERVVEFIRDYYKKNNLKGAILGISGGKDSGVVAGLMVRALGKENVFGISICKLMKNIINYLPSNFFTRDTIPAALSS